MDRLTDKLSVTEVLYATFNTLVVMSEDPKAWPRERWLQDRLNRLIAEVGAVAELIVTE